MRADASYGTVWDEADCLIPDSLPQIFGLGNTLIVYGKCVSKMERLVEKLEMENATSMTDEERFVRYLSRGR
jgi:hypothetical protein